MPDPDDFDRDVLDELEADITGDVVPFERRRPGPHCPFRGHPEQCRRQHQSQPASLMARMGHDSHQAALIYLDPDARAGRAIADSVSAALRAEGLGAAPVEAPDDDGAGGALVRSADGP